jgi:hypothetical protein
MQGMAKTTGPDFIPSVLNKMEQLQQEFDRKAKADELAFTKLIELNRNHAERVHGLFAQVGQALGGLAKEGRAVKEKVEEHDQRLSKLEELFGT